MQVGLFGQSKAQEHLVRPLGQKGQELIQWGNPIKANAIKGHPVDLPPVPDLNRQEEMRQSYGFVILSHL